MQIFPVSYRYPNGPEPPGNGRNVGVGKGHTAEVDGFALLGEMVHFRTVSGIVVDDAHERQLQADGGIQLADAHQEPAVTGAENRQPVRPGQRRPDGGVKPEANGLECLGETKTELIRHRQVLAGIAHEISGVHRNNAVRGKDRVEFPAQNAGINRRRRGQVGRFHVTPSRRLLDAHSIRLGAVLFRLHRLHIFQADQRIVRGEGRVAKHPQRNGPVGTQ